MRFTPDNIISLAPNEVFVFGSNEAGRHGAGAALIAERRFGAVDGVGFGFQGNSFAIPTKDWRIQSLPIESIRFYVSRFIAYAAYYNAANFLVTKIGCGLAGFNVQDIAPLFGPALRIQNIILPREFYEVILL